MYVLCRTQSIQIFMSNDMTDILGVNRIDVANVIYKLLYQPFRLRQQVIASMFMSLYCMLAGAIYTSFY